MKSDRSWAEKPRRPPDLVEDYRRYLKQIVGSDENPYEQVLIYVDEMWALLAMLRAYQTQSNGNGLREAEDTSENAPSKATLPLEALMLTFFYATVSKVFKALDEASWQAGERSGLFERMAAIRRSLMQDAATMASSIDAARQEFKLASAAQWLGTVASGGGGKAQASPSGA